MDANYETQRRYVCARFAILEAGRLTWDYFERGVECELKSDETPVTIADRESETYLRRIFQKNFPGDGFVGEEHGEEPSTTGFRWIIDPIDATANFVRGIPIYGNLVGLEHEGTMVAGLCNVPGLNALYHAMKGHGAFKNDRPIRASGVGRIQDAQLCYPELEKFDRRGWADFFLDMTRSAKRSRGFGDFWMFMLVAQGSADICLEPVASVWDLAALQPICEEAGARFTDWSGNPTSWGNGAIVANPTLHALVLERFAKYH